jgi:hypothetical protein
MKKSGFCLWIFALIQSSLMLEYANCKVGTALLMVGWSYGWSEEKIGIKKNVAIATIFF